MEKLTKTDFGKLTADAAYSAYDDAMNASIEARSAQANAIAENESYNATKAEDAKKAADALKAAQDKAAADLAAANQSHADALTAKEAARIAVVAELVQCEAKLAELETVLGGTEAGEKLLRQKKRNELAKKITDAQAAKDAAAAELATIPSDN